MNIVLALGLKMTTQIISWASQSSYLDVMKIDCYQPLFFQQRVFLFHDQRRRRQKVQLRQYSQVDAPKILRVTGLMKSISPPNIFAPSTCMRGSFIVMLDKLYAGRYPRRYHPNLKTERSLARPSVFLPKHWVQVCQVCTSQLQASAQWDRSITI